MNKQEIFDFVANHLIVQRVMAREGNACKYRVWKDDVLLKCAAGCLIPDEIYTPKMERKLVRQLISPFKDVLPKWFIEHLSLIEDLQGVHDYSGVNRDGTFIMDSLKNRLAELALYHDLRMIEI